MHFRGELSANRKLYCILILAVFVLASGCSGQVSSTESQTTSRAGKEVGKKAMEDKVEKSGSQKATFASGCFWCVEAVFQQLEGVEKVVSGYSGGTLDNPTYEEVCTGTTGHAEACQITYDPRKISYDELLEVFWKTHDPTTTNRQGSDVGTQYRSAVFYHNEEQKRLAEGYKAKLEAEHIWTRPIVTEIVPFEKFWPAENYHQNYFNNNPGKGYCMLVINPKVEKFRKVFKDRLKKK
jgi:peptide-methionine (S)-S-oxide reductase